MFQAFSTRPLQRRFQNFMTVLRLSSQRKVAFRWTPCSPFSKNSSYDSNDASLAWRKDGKVYNKGPDQIIPSSAIYTWRPDGAVKLSKLGTGEMTQVKAVSVPTLFERVAQQSPNHMAMAAKRDGQWQKWTYKQYLDDVKTAAKGFVALGLEPYHSVCIMGNNDPEWLISDLAAIYAGGFATGFYTTNSWETCAYIAKDSQANIIAVEDDMQLQKILRCKNELPHLKAIIQYTGEPKDPNVYSWSRLMKLGSEQNDDILKERLKTVAINQCCTLIYTSGTTGNPKGVMLSHDNLTWLAMVNCNYFGFKHLGEQYVSFLPLSHAAAQMADLFCCLTCSASIYFGGKAALQGGLVDVMKEIKPTKILAVPRVWEKMYEALQDHERSMSGVRKTVFDWAKAKGLEYNLKRQKGDKNAETAAFRFANKLVLSKIKDALGVTNADAMVSAAAPINLEILKYFLSLNIVVTEAYGMSECAGPHSMAREHEFRIGSVGKTLPGVVTKLDKPSADGTGEICMGGRHVQMGYLNQPEKTRDAIDDEGWLHSEDIGAIDKDGYLFVTGRLKELLITAGGENIAPVPIENEVKTALPVLSQAMLLGDKLKFLSILLTLKTDINKDTLEPKDTLVPFVKEWVQTNGDCKAATIPEVLTEINEKKNEKLISAIQAGIDKANEKALSRAHMIQKWYILPTDFSIPGGEFGPTLKLKRPVVVEKYQNVIHKLYDV